ncbi:MAG: helix-turn-helix transcriptional regulator [Acidimicrobiia bacterium]
MDMVPLSKDDASAVLALVEAVGEAATVDDYATVAMTGLLDLIPCIDASYNEMNPAANRVRWAALPNPGNLLEQFVPVFQKYMLQNPLVRHFEETGDTRAMMWSDLMTLEEIHATDLHRKMFGHIGVDSQLAVTLPAPPGIVVGFAVNTGLEGFTERDRAIMNALRPHLGHAYRSIQLRDELSLAHKALRTRGWTGALADHTGVVRAVTDNADDSEHTTGVALREGEPLPEPLRSSYRTGVGRYHPSQPAVRSSPTRLSEDAQGVAGWHVPGPIAPHVVIVETHVDASKRRLTEAGLSPRQVQVALQLAEGGTNAVIAGRMGIAEGTVRKHLERIYRALEVTDRASAIASIRGW